MIPRFLINLIKSRIYVFVNIFMFFLINFMKICILCTKKTAESIRNRGFLLVVQEVEGGGR